LWVPLVVLVPVALQDLAGASLPALERPRSPAAAWPVASTHRVVAGGPSAGRRVAPPYRIVVPCRATSFAAALAATPSKWTVPCARPATRPTARRGTRTR